MNSSKVIDQLRQAALAAQAQGVTVAPGGMGVKYDTEKQAFVLKGDGPMCILGAIVLGKKSALQNEYITEENGGPYLTAQELLEITDLETNGIWWGFDNVPTDTDGNDRTPEQLEEIRAARAVGQALRQELVK